MKRILAISAAVLMLASVLCACSGTATISDMPNGAYGNVSTTDDGRVNGTNDYMNGSGYTTYGNTTGTYSSTNDNGNYSGNHSGSGMNGSSAGGMNGSSTGSMNGTSGTNRTTTNTGRGTSAGGTGMTNGQ